MLVIDRAVPASQVGGTTVNTTFFGAGFSASPVDVLKGVKRDLTQFDPDGEPVYVDDPLVTIGVVTFVSGTEITADVTTDAAFLAGSYIQVDYNRG